MTDGQARALGACVAAGGVAVFPADTVYGLACDPENADAVAKLYALKGRPPEKPAAVMFFDLSPGDFGGLLPGGVTLLCPIPSGATRWRAPPTPRRWHARAVPRAGRAAGAAVEREPGRRHPTRGACPTCRSRSARAPTS